MLAAARFGGVQAGLYEGAGRLHESGVVESPSRGGASLLAFRSCAARGNRDVIADASFTFLDQLASVLKKHPSIAILFGGSHQ